MEERKLKILIFLSVVTGATLLISNVAATKLWDFCGIAVDGGILIFPLSYIVGDIAMEFFGRKTANHIIYCAFVINVVAAIVFLAVGALPPHPEWGGQEAYDIILGFAPRITLASLVAFICSNLANNYIFDKIREKGKADQMFAKRALGSSIVGRLLDSLIFETLAFAGVLPQEEFFKQVAFAYAAGCVLEIILTPFSSIAVHKIHKFIDEGSL